MVERGVVGFALMLLSLSCAAGCGSNDGGNADGSGGTDAGSAGSSSNPGPFAGRGGGGASSAGSTSAGTGGGSQPVADAGSPRGGSAAPPADAGSKPPQHFPIAGSGGNPSPGDSGLPTDLEGTCSTDADCELCTGPLGIGDPCCGGCPLISSHEVCAQIRAAMSACQPGMIGLCPQVSCLAPGSPKCSPEGKCTMGNGIEM